MGKPNLTTPWQLIYLWLHPAGHHVATNEPPSRLGHHVATNKPPGRPGHHVATNKPPGKPGHHVEPNKPPGKSCHHVEPNKLPGKPGHPVAPNKPWGEPSHHVATIKFVPLLTCTFPTIPYQSHSTKSQDPFFKTIIFQGGLQPQSTYPKYSNTTD